ncbi:MAG TPA: dihydropyrimidinase [Myxococcales bacterium]|jgi:dihydropyrimidinase
MKPLMIRGGTIVTASDQFVGDVICEDGVIRAVGRNLDKPAGAELVDAGGSYVFPGGIDAHTHMELPFMGGVSADDFYTGTAAALAGGTTTILDFVIPGRGQSLVEAKNAWMEKAKKSCSDFGFHLAVTWYGDQVKKDMKQVLEQDGIRSFKVFLAYKGSLGVGDDELFGVLQTGREIGALISAHCEHGDVVAALQQRLLAVGKTEPRYHALSRPAYVEGEATNRFVNMARAVCEAKDGWHAHPSQAMTVYVVHLTCKESMDAVYRARQMGQRVLVETCPQYLLLDDSVYDKPNFEGAAYVMSPPIRPQGNQDYLWNALASGLIQVVATDHCPFRQADQKVAGKDAFTKIPNGAAGVEDRLSLMYTYGVAAGRISLQQFVDVCCTQPARIFGLYPRKGTIAVGSDADLLVYDPNGTRKISAKTHHQAVDRNIYEGFEIKGRIAATIARGRIQYQDGELKAERGAGRYLKRGPAVA